MNDPFKLINHIQTLIFLLIYLLSGINLTKKEIIRSLFPITFQNNWFITAYIIFIIIVPYLNIIIKNLTQKQLFRLSSILFILYFMIGFVKNSYYLTELIIFIIIYLIVNYFKLYMEYFWNNKKRCMLIVIIRFLQLNSFTITN